MSHSFHYNLKYINCLRIGSLKESGKSQYKGEAEGSVQTGKTINVKVKCKLTVLPNKGGTLRLEMRKEVTRKFAILIVTYNAGNSNPPSSYLYSLIVSHLESQVTSIEIKDISQVTQRIQFVTSTSTKLSSTTVITYRGERAL